MKIVSKLLTATILCGMLSAGVAVADTWVNGYVKSNGTYVQGHMRSSPNSTKSDNYGRKSANSYGTYDRDTDGDGIYNQYDNDDNGNGISDDNERW